MTRFDFWNSVLSSLSAFELVLLQSVSHSSRVIHVNCRLDHATLLRTLGAAPYDTASRSSLISLPTTRFPPFTLFSLLFPRHVRCVFLSEHWEKSLCEMLLPSPWNVFFQVSTGSLFRRLCEAFPSSPAPHSLTRFPKRLVFSTALLPSNVCFIFLYLDIFIQTQDLKYVSST